jgi:hypothetical protein
MPHQQFSQRKQGAGGIPSLEMGYRKQTGIVQLLSAVHPQYIDWIVLTLIRQFHLGGGEVFRPSM